MAQNSLFDFRLKVDILELESKSESTTVAPDARSSLSQFCSVTTTKSAAAAAAEIETVIAPKIAKTVATVTRIDYAIHTLDTFEIGPNDIEYRAEGNANIVLVLPQRCQVLRLPKQQQLQRDSSGRHQNICYSTADATAKIKECSRNERIFYVYKYIAGVSALFGRSNISARPTLVRIEFTNIGAFNKWLHNRRPIHRIQSASHGDQLIFDYGLLYHDACRLRFCSTEIEQGVVVVDDVLAVEIKPKQGWNICTLPESLLQLMGIGVDVRNRCRFCAMQYLKVKGHQVNQISKYCPMDLFSGDVLRMKKSIHNLITAPQNNFRVFHNGRCVYADEHDERDLQSLLSSYIGNDTKSMDDFIMLLINILQYDFNGDTVNPMQTKNPLQTTTLTAKIKGCADIQQHSKHSPSPQSSILNRVLDLQLLAKKTMPYVAQKYLDDETGWNKLINSPSSNWPHSHVVEMCQKLGQFNDENTHDAVDYDHLKSTCNLCDEELYEMGATALDCSIMLTIQRVKNQMDLSKPEYPTINLNGAHFMVNATVFDLDPKLYPHHFSKYVEKTKDSFRAFKQSLNADPSR